jgi:hypothetical protein
VGGRCPVGIEVSRDLLRARAFRSLAPDSFDYLGGHERRTTSNKRRGQRQGGSSPLREESLELVDRD